MPLGDTAEPTGNGARLPQFNLQASLPRENDAEKEEMDMEDEEKDTMPDMPDMDAQKSFTKSVSRANTFNRSATRLSRLHSSARAAGTMRQSFQRLRSTASGSGPQFDSQRSAVLERLASDTGRNPEDVLVSARSFENAVTERLGSSVFAARLFESQNPEGAEEVPAERLVDALLTLEHASLEDHLRITFELLDTRNDGTIARENLDEILRVAFLKLKIPVTDKQLQRTSEALIHDIHASRAVQEETTLTGIGEEETLMEAKLNRINSGVVTQTVRFEELVDLLKRHIEGVERQHSKRIGSGQHRAAWSQKLHGYWLDFVGIRHLPFFVLFWLGMAFSFFAGYWQNYKNLNAHVSGCAYPLAKAFAQVIQPLSFLLLFAVCRRTITALRNTPLRYLLPFDESISFHRLCGYLIFLCSAGHTIAHIANYSIWASPSYTNKWVETFPTTPQPTTRSLCTTETSITGYIMWGALLLGYPFATWYPRKAKVIEKTAVGKVLNNFTIFSITHILMWIIFYVALIIHPYPGTPSQHFDHHSVTWIYIALPFLLYVAERAWRLIRNVAFKGDLLDIELLPGKDGRGGVTVLRMRRPRDFSYKPGMYMFINVPALSVMEWHPFTITSAPGDPYVSVHIRDAGDWTHALYEHMSTYAKGVEATLPPMEKQLGSLGSFRDSIPNSLGSMSLARSMTLSQTKGGRSHGKPDLKMAQRQATFAPGAGSGLEPTLQRRRTRASLRACNWDPLPNAPLVLLDGPYNAPALHWEDYEVVVLVGAGIGVTPFASVLADMVNKLEGSAVCEECGHTSHAAGDAAGIRVNKIYFHWVVSDSTAPNYFASTLETISSDDQLGLVEPRIHLTGRKPATGDGPDLHHVFVKLGQEALFKERGVDIVTGLKSKVVTEFGRPNWKKIMATVADQHPGQTVGVFVCGPPPFTHDIKHACRDFNTSASTRIKVLDDEMPDLEAGAPVLKKTVFDFYEEYF
jgi:respiratory burst oxidase